MKKQISPGALLSPVPAVLVSCGTVEKPNLLTIAWVGTVCTHPAMVSISVRPERFSYPLIKESGEFVINLPGESMVKTLDFCGVKSGRNTDKFAVCGLTAVPAAGVSAPAVAECPVSFSCKVKEVIPLGSHDMFLAEIVAIEAEEWLFEESGRLALEKMGMVAYAHGEYFSLGEKLGSFGYSVRKKKPAVKSAPAKPPKKSAEIPSGAQRRKNTERSYSAKKKKSAPPKSGHKKTGIHHPVKGGSR
ncbi:MAG TPA: flavin reductase family protein [Candidatus Faecivivens stercoripullorum]|uniref:Flavin reductase family protein n=1 Tax=Candidatus Faecivivens stercoripullorum TaxID=2840805 RepID=A0A9D1KQR2_9FIRM|nr:flavin reductase family protein [Candidatus Faecivivens stercoripullorum]